MKNLEHEIGGISDKNRICAQNPVFTHADENFIYTGGMKR